MTDQQTKVLVVDDEPDIVELVQYNLVKEGFEVVTANSGLVAIEMAKKEHPDVILLDIMMPEMDGVEVCRNLRQEEEFKDTFIAFLTARNEDFTQIAALDAGGDDFITKPIRPRVLVSRIRAMTRRSRRSGEQQKNNNIITVGEIIIDKEKFTVVKNDVTFDLAKKEFELVSLLASRPGKVFTREEIFSKIWGPNIIVGNRTIDVHIRKLREKLGDKVIKTVKGIGYKFEI